MYVCVCHAVTETEVAAAVESGASTVEAVGDYTGAGTSCGTCHDHIDEVILGCAADVRPRLTPASPNGPSPADARLPPMQGDARVIEFLNEQLTGELTAINQYFLHAKMQENWGFVKLAAHTKAESIEEMHHAEILTDRILFLEGLPNYPAAVLAAHRPDAAGAVRVATWPSSTRPSTGCAPASSTCARSATSPPPGSSRRSSPTRRSTSTTSRPSSSCSAASARPLYIAQLVEQPGSD